MRTEVLGSLLLLAIPLTVAAPQERLLERGAASVGVTYESWSFGDGVLQPTRTGDTTVLIEGTSQISVPLSSRVSLTEHWTLSLATAYSNGRVELAGPDPEFGRASYRLSGFTDARLRAVGRLSSGVALTLGLNLPTGKTSLDPEEFSAFRILAAPALGLRFPRLGSGVSGTAGVVLSRELGSAWAGAVGVSYELRGSYEPGTVVAALSNADYSPGDALRVSLGIDGLVGQSGMTLGLTAEFYPNQDRITDSALGEDGFLSTQLGPVISADLQLRLGARGFRELTLYAVERYRTEYRSGTSQGDGPVPESSGNYLDLGARGIIPAGRATGVLAVANFRHQTGLDSDETIATAGLVSGALTLGLVRELGGGYFVQPFVRGQLGSIKSGARSSTATGLGAGVALGTRF